MGVMIDIETWGVLPGSALRSVGAVIFDERSGVQETFSDGALFYANVTKSLGRREPATIDWWARQSDCAQRAFESPEPMAERDVLEALADFACGHGNVWANDPDFDCVLLRSLYEAHGFKYPFAFWSHRSVRTACDMLEVSRTKYRPSVAHHALHDAVAQAQRVQFAYSKLGRIDR